MRRGGCTEVVLLGQTGLVQFHTFLCSLPKLNLICVALNNETNNYTRQRLHLKVLHHTFIPLGLLLNYALFSLTGLIYHHYWISQDVHHTEPLFVTSMFSPFKDNQLSYGSNSVTRNFLHFLLQLSLLFGKNQKTYSHLHSATGTLRQYLHFDSIL